MDLVTILLIIIICILTNRWCRNG